MNEELKAFYCTFTFKVSQPGVITIIAKDQDEATSLLKEKMMGEIKPEDMEILQIVDLDDVESLRKQQQERFATNKAMAQLERDLGSEDAINEELAEVLDLSQFRNKDDEPTLN